MNEQLGDLPALGSPTGQAHHRALLVNFSVSSAHNPTDKSLFWQEAKHA